MQRAMARPFGLSVLMQSLSAGSLHSLKSVQKLPSPMVPGGHEQLKPPMRFMQIAVGSHRLVEGDAHSSMSTHSRVVEFNSKPGSHRHSHEPARSVQRSARSQSWVPTAHSLICVHAVAVCS